GDRFLRGADFVREALGDLSRHAREAVVGGGRDVVHARRPELDAAVGAEAELRGHTRAARRALRRGARAARVAEALARDQLRPTARAAHASRYAARRVKSTAPDVTVSRNLSGVYHSLPCLDRRPDGGSSSERTSPARSWMHHTWWGMLHRSERPF